MNKTIKISIITVVFNAVSTIERTIKSVIDQNYDNIEYIIIDGGSTDGTLEIIDKYKDYISYFHSKKDNGIYDAMNQGINIATGDYIALLNADDWLEKDAVETVVNALISQGNIDILHANINYVKENKKILYKPKFGESRFFWHGMSYYHPTFFVNKEVYKKLKYDEKYKLLSDYKFTMQCLKNNFNFYHLDKPLVNFSADGASSAFWLRIKEGHNIRLELDYSIPLVYLSGTLRISKTIAGKIKNYTQGKIK